jgi:discoidin domain receptor family protein 2
VIDGNSNTYLESKHELEPPIWASKIRFLPYSYHRRTVCMRVELYGCPWNDGIVSYSMPQGDKRNNWEFFDATYDGYWDGQLLRGLGQLTDGKIGPDNFKMSYYDNYDRGQGWVGWKNDTRSGHPLEIKFEFDHVREFSAVHVYCNNQFTKDVQVRFNVTLRNAITRASANRRLSETRAMTREMDRFVSDSLPHSSARTFELAATLDNKREKL